MTAATSSPGSADIRRTLDAFLLAALKACELAKHDRAVPLEELAKELGVSGGLAEKIATFLEGEGLVDYDDQAIDITVDGILKAEEILRGGDKKGNSDEKKVSSDEARR